MVRTNKQIIFDFPNVNASFGTVNKLNPKVVYLSCKWWVKSTHPYKEEFLEKLLDNIKLSFGQKIKESDDFSDRIIFVPIDYITPLEPNENKYMSFDVYLKQKVGCRKVEELRDEIYRLLSNVIQEFERDYNKHNIEISKQRIR